MRLEVISEYNQLKDFHGPWNDLLSTRSEKPLPLTHEWMIAWWKNFGNNRELSIFCVYDSERLVAIAPFMKVRIPYRRIPVTQLRLMANGHSPFCDVILDGSLNQTQIFQVLDVLLRANSEDLMVFAKLPETSQIYALLAERSSSYGYRYGEKGSLVTPILQISESWESYFRSRSRKFRKNITNKLNRFKKEKDFTIDREIISSSEFSVLEEIVQISKCSWKKRVNNDLGSNLAGRKFLFDLVDAFGPSDAVHIWIMRKAGMPVAFELHLLFDGVAYPLRADFNESFREYSPGSVLECVALKSLFDEKKILQYDSCADNYWYLNNWTDDVRKHFDVEIFSTGFKSLFLHAVEYRIIPLYRQLRSAFRK